MAKQNRKEFTRITPNICPACGEQNGYLTAEKAQFRVGTVYNDGPCPKCKPAFDKMVDILAAGGILVTCKCGGVTAVMEAEGNVIQMPDGTRRLEVNQCGLCSHKEGNDAQAHNPECPGEGGQGDLHSN